MGETKMERVMGFQVRSTRSSGIDAAVVIGTLSLAIAFLIGV